ncbi:hypothetical protein [Lentibacter sp.]
MQDTPKRKRWLDNMIKAAKDETHLMPWQRGQRRAVFISARGTSAQAA